MSDNSDVRARIETDLKASRGVVLRGNTLESALDMVAGTLILDRATVWQGLRGMFMNREKVIQSKRASLTQDAMLDILCAIETKLDTPASKAPKIHVVNGMIEIVAIGGLSAVGVDIEAGSPPVRFENGTHIKVQTTGIASTIGLRIGKT